MKAQRRWRRADKDVDMKKDWQVFRPASSKLNFEEGRRMTARGASMGITGDIRLRRDSGAAGYGFRISDFRGFPQEWLSIGHTKA
jgi:hypothetical protein